MTLFDVEPAVTDYMIRWAELSDDGLYRWLLGRIWDSALPVLVLIMLNPSTADGKIDDPTIRRCIGFARDNGYGAIIVLNIFAWRATNPDALTGVVDPVGRLNDALIITETDGRDVLCAWGASVPTYWRHRPPALVAILRELGRELHHLGLTQDGSPRHPLYVRADTPITKWAA